MGNPSAKKKVRRETQEGDVEPPLQVKERRTGRKEKPKRADLKIGHYKRRKDLAGIRFEGLGFGRG
jgi:hypothetical protein